MEENSFDFTRKLLLWGGPIVGVHFLVVLWHLVRVLKVQPGFPRLAIPLLILVNLLPIAGLITFAKGYHKLGGILIIVPLGIALVIGVYEHFLSPGTDNVFHMPPGDLRLPFQASAVVLALLEGPGCWVGFRIFTQPTDTRRELYAN
jgi:hypothetical protein